MLYTLSKTLSGERQGGRRSDHGRSERARPVERDVDADGLSCQRAIDAHPDRSRRPERAPGRLSIRLAI